MKCSRCPLDVAKLFESVHYSDGPICAFCDISMSRQFPGLAGVAYASDQVDPRANDEVAELRHTIKVLQKCRNPRERMPDSEAAFVAGVFQRDQDTRKAQEARIGKRTLQRQAAVANEHEQQDVSDHNAEKTEARRALKDTNRTFRRWKQSVGIKVD